MAVVGPLYMFAGVIGVLVGLYILTDLDVALFAVIAVIGLITAVILGLTFIPKDFNLEAEGTLLPETFKVPRSTSRAQVLALLRKEQQSFLAAHWEPRAPDLPFATKEEGSPRKTCHTSSSPSLQRRSPDKARGWACQSFTVS